MGTLGKVALGYLALPLLVGVPLVLFVLLAAPAASGCIRAPGDGQVSDAAVPAAYAALVNDAATTHAIPARWLAAVVTAESAWDPRARSTAGAMGLAQLMPATAARLGVSDPYDPRQSIDGGARYLAELYGSFGTWDLAVAAYNAGPNAVRRHGGIPPFAETRGYVPRVRALAEQYGTADGDPIIVCAEPAVGDAAPLIVGDVACPVGQPHNFSDTWGAPRSGGRTHKGVDIFADIGVPNYAYQAGTVRLTSSPLGGISLWLTTDAGDRAYYAHLSRYAPGITTGTRVSTGQLIGYTGNTGNARYTPPHTHWEFHPGGRGAVNPTPYARAACSTPPR